MEEISRRRLLIAGGALGTFGALGLASPVHARSLWTWSPAGSVAGKGAGLDPEWVWDDEIDAIIAEVIERGQVPRVNDLLRNWLRNDQPLPAGLPGDLRDWMEEARRLPSWADTGKLQDAVGFTRKKGLYTGILYGLGSGLLSTAIPREARAVYYSKGGADMKDRVAKTAKLGYDVGDLYAYKPQGSMIATSVRTRLVHAAVRHLLPQSPGWSRTSGGQTIPISQADMMVTWHSLPTYVMGTLKKWKVPMTATEREGFLHVWQVTAHMLGIRDEYIPATWAEADSQSKQVLDPIIANTSEGEALTDAILEIVAEVDAGLTEPLINAFSRYIVGDSVGDKIGLDREPLLQPVINNAWPLVVAFREGLIPLPLIPSIAWTLEEALRRFVLLFMSEGRDIHLEIPDANRPS
ncbi:oxygenase MpaB family protein [Streptomyces sp. NPDC085927]|uniref:oxygenase MpaB family protein n=1 Tax=Streptomyces sp. NPDC085927 TaxID=3365738 RepID=UPI0037D6A24C